ncbi:MAG: prepilin-type N-terminal cleavage/methylation domain-containing protein [Candidatus Kaiserbacteria bacterium]|nr:MAG: prepilin-type N-terminal cleavage/methylation domain-containing protein [Candidatus Kaiserbacteria bacterium]
MMHEQTKRIERIADMKVVRGFTLIETLVAVSLLSVAIVAPMSLTGRSLAAAYYARDQVTAFHLAQEGIESVRHARDHNILLNALGTPADLLAGIPSTTGDPFTVDTTNNDAMALCNPLEACPALRTNGELYGYNEDWNSTRFTRSISAVFVDGSTDEVKVNVVVSWQSGAFQSRSVTISENLYRWVREIE